MRNKKDTKIRNKKIFLIVMVLIVSVWTFTNIFYVFNLMEYIKALESMKEKEETSNTTIQENTLTKEEIEENTNELEIADLKDKDERTRIQQYCGKFIRYIENKEYDKAYNLLYPDFKNNYFKTVEDFKKYAEEKFPQTLIAVEYNNIERQGQYYILFTTIKTPLNVDYSMDQKFILIENGFNDFKISFDVKQ